MRRFACRALERRIPERDRIEIFLDARAVRGRRLDRAVAARRQPEFLQRLEIKLERDRRGCADEADVLGPVEIGLVGVLVVALLRREMMLVEAAVGDVGVELLRVGRAVAVALAVRAAKAGERADARAALVIDDVVRIAAGIARRAGRR